MFLDEVVVFSVLFDIFSVITSDYLVSSLSVILFFLENSDQQRPFFNMCHLRFLSNLFYFCSWVCSIIPFQRCRLILCSIEGQSEFSTIANSSIDGNIKICLNRHFFRCIYWLNIVFYPAISWCHFFSLLKFPNAWYCNYFYLKITLFY